MRSCRIGSGRCQRRRNDLYVLVILIVRTGGVGGAVDQALGRAAISRADNEEVGREVERPAIFAIERLDRLVRSLIILRRERGVRPEGDRKSTRLNSSH